MDKITRSEAGYWLMIQDFSLWLEDGEIPFGTLQGLALGERVVLEIGRWQGFPVFLTPAEEQDQQRTFAGLRSQIYREEPLRNLLHRAVSLHNFFMTYRFCPSCHTELTLSEQEICRRCPSCGRHFYPTISPSIIVAVRKGRQILLANHQRHKGSIYTTLAGFVEAGESLEKAVEREVWEESGLKIKNLRYFGSQPWAFPNSLMVGFLADYDSGEICLQEEELCDAQWFDCDQPLPELPPKGTIALALIQETLALCRRETEREFAISAKK